MPRQTGGLRPKPYQRLGTQIAELRFLSDATLTQERLAQRVGISAGYLSNIENGYSQPSTRHLKAIAAALAADYNELARLAGYQEEPADADWTPPAELVPYFREMSEAGRSAVEQAVAFIRTVQRGLGDAVEADKDKARRIKQRRAGRRTT